MSQFTPFSGLLGGSLVGAAAAVLLLVHGRLAGISGIVAGLLRADAGDSAWRVFFVAGLLAGGLVLRHLLPGAFAGASQGALSTVAVAGLLVGTGARWAGGCTSGHGVCGTARLSVRSIVATILFVAAGALSVRVVHALHSFSPFAGGGS